MAATLPDPCKPCETSVRELLPKLLDNANIPHGDLVVPSDKAHSGRYIISQWQRIAAGAAVVVMAQDAQNNSYILLGTQRGKISIPQGYMETKLPKEDLSGLAKQKASRLNRTTGKTIPHDTTLEDTALREVKEEAGINATKEQLIPLGTKSDAGETVPMIVQSFLLLLPKPVTSYTPKTLDHEFANDDLKKPRWVKLADITEQKGAFFIKGKKVELGEGIAPLLKSAVQKAAEQELQKNSKGLFLTEQNMLAHYRRQLQSVVGEKHAEEQVKSLTTTASPFTAEWRERQQKIEALTKTLTKKEEPKTQEAKPTHHNHNHNRPSLTIRMQAIGQQMEIRRA